MFCFSLSFVSSFCLPHRAHWTPFGLVILTKHITEISNFAFDPINKDLFYFRFSVLNLLGQHNLFLAVLFSFPAIDPCTFLSRSFVLCFVVDRSTLMCLLQTRKTKKRKNVSSPALDVRSALTNSDDQRGTCGYIGSTVGVLEGRGMTDEVLTEDLMLEAQFE